MAIAFDAVSQSTVGSVVNALSWSHTCTGSNRMLLVAVYLFDSTDADRDVTSVTYNGTSMTEVAEKRAGTSSYYVSLWSLVNPDNGSAHTVSVTLAGDNTKAVGVACSLTGAKQTSNPSASNNATADSTSISTAVTVANNGWIVDAIVVEGSTSDIIETSPQANRAEVSGVGTGMCGVSTNGPKTPSASYASEWSWASTRDAAHIVAAIDPTSTEQTVALTETVTIGEARVFSTFKTFLNTLTVTDVIAISFLKELVEAVALADTTTRAVSKYLIDVSVLLDSSLHAMNRTLSETLTVFDEVVQKTVTKLSVEILSLTDSISKSIGTVRLDTLELGDSLDKRTERLLNETISLADTLELLKAFVKLLVEVLTLIDSQTKFLNRTSIETLSLTDERSISLQRVLTELLTLVDTLEALIQNFTIELMETLGLDDLALKDTSKYLHQALVLNDVRLNECFRTIQETLSMTDARTLSVERRLSEALTLTDATIRDTQKRIIESMVLSDTRTSHIARALFDTFVLIDELIKGFFFSRVLEENLSMTGELSRNTMKYIIQALSLTDLITLTATITTSKQAKILGLTAMEAIPQHLIVMGSLA